MAKRRTVDASKVIEAVESGRLDKDIMVRFGLENMKRGKARMRESPAQRERGLHGRGQGRGRIQINRRGSLVLPRDMVEAMGFRQGDSFVVRKTRAGLSLKKN